MGRDATLLEQANLGVAGARIYFWDSVWVTLGKSQKPEDALLDLSIKSVVRPTGGAAVLHGHDLTIGIAMPLADLGCSGREVKKAFFGLTTPILKTLRKVGVNAVLARDLHGSFSSTGEIGRATEAKKEATPYCFALKSDYDVLNADSGEKICGCAMKVTAQAALLQASIPIEQPLVNPQEILKSYSHTPHLKIDAREFFEVFKADLP